MTPEQHAAWLAERAKSMGASDIAAAATGLYGGAAKAVASKLGLNIGDEIDPALADRGHRWEQPIADGVRCHHGLAVYGEQALIRRPDQPRIHVTLDGLLGPNDLDAPTLDDMVATLEVKTRGPHAPWQWDYWRAQCQVGMWVTWMPRALLAIATIDEDYDPATGGLVQRLVSIRYEWLDADPFEQERLVDLGLELWAHVERGELPEPTGAEALPYIKAANIDADPDAVAEIDDLAEMIEQRERIKATAKQAADLAKTIEAKIRHRLGAATEATTTDGRWRVRCGQPVRKFTDQSEVDFLELHAEEAAGLDLLRTVLDRAAAKERMPDEYEALKIATPDRRLTVADLQPEEN
jgi:predicted phage-related endonuclease